MPNMLKATLPYPPTVNHYWLIGNRRVRISDEGRQYRRRVRGILAGVPTLAGAVALSVDVYPPDGRRRDIDNVLKALLDAMEHAGVYGDDSQVTALRVFKHRHHPGEAARVEVAAHGLPTHSEFDQFS